MPERIQQGAQSLTLALLALAGLLLPLLARLSLPLPAALTWLLDLALHWQWLYALLLALGVSLHLLLSRSARRWWALLLLSALALPAHTAAPRLPPAEGDAAVLTLVTANLNRYNRDASALLAWMRQQDADLVLLQELSPAMADALQRSSGYALQYLWPGDTPLGFGLLSRLPLDQVQLQRNELQPSIQATLSWQGQAVQLLVVHPMPPMSLDWLQMRDTSLQHWAAAMQMQGGPALIIGDMNITPWVPLMQQLADQGWRRSTSLRPSWPAAFGGWMGIPIDHVLASPHWRVLDAVDGPAGDSDHRPQRIRLSLGPAAAG